MALTTVLSVQIRENGRRRYEDLVRQLAERAVKQKHEDHWTAHETTFGDLETFHFVSEVANFAELERRGAIRERLVRVLGDQDIERFLADMSECMEAQRHTIWTFRPELSYPPDQGQSARAASFLGARRNFRPTAIVTITRTRPGHQEAFEELLRKLSEAIPKLRDQGHIITYQAVVGDPAEYWTVRPLIHLREFDDHRGPIELLVEAFGAAEGNLIHRHGLEAIEHSRRQILRYRQDLSNPD